MANTLKVLTEKQCSEYVNYLSDQRLSDNHKRSHHRNYTMILIMLDAGLRVSEVSKLTRGCVMFADHFCDVVAVPASIAKTKVERTIPLTNRLKEAIEIMNNLYWTPDQTLITEYAFYTVDSKLRISPRQIQRIVEMSSLEAIGISINPHMLRHTFATRLMSTTNIRIVQQLLGHASIQSTQIYTHPNNLDLKKAIESLNERKE